MAKAWTTLRGREVVALGRELLGGNGIVADFLVAKAFCDMEAYYTYEGARRPPPPPLLRPSELRPCSLAHPRDCSLVPADSPVSLRAAAAQPCAPAGLLPPASSLAVAGGGAPPGPQPATSCRS